MERHFDRFLKILIDLQQLAESDRAFTIAFASSRSGEGTTTLVCNAAIAVASNMTRKTLLVDAGSGGSGPLKFLGIPPDRPGLFDIIDGKADLDNVLLGKERGLFVLPAGNIPRYPIAFFEKTEFQGLIEDLQERFDVVFFDTPPVVSSPVTPLLTSFLDATILVVEAEKTRWEVAGHARDVLNEAGAKVVGAILNKKQMFIPDFIYKYLL